jgi:hypothetical protein
MNHQAVAKSTSSVQSQMPTVLLILCFFKSFLAMAFMEHSFEAQRYLNLETSVTTYLKFSDSLFFEG